MLVDLEGRGSSTDTLRPNPQSEGKDDDDDDGGGGGGVDSIN